MSLSLQICAEIGWGAQRHETEFGPKAIQSYLNIQYEHIISCQTSFHSISSLPYAQRLKEVHQVAHELMQTVISSIKQNHFPIVIGGDETIGIGTWSGLVLATQLQKKFGLIWLDAHMDAHTPQTSPSQAIHGMPLAILLGEGEKSLVELGGIAPKLSPEHVVLIGVRSFEKGEADFLKKNRVKIYFIDEVRRKGLSEVMREAVEYLDKRCDHFGLNLDLDVFDPRLVPAVGTPEPDGIRNLSEIKKSFQYLHQHPNLAAIEISEFNPLSNYLKISTQLLKYILNPWLTQGNDE